LCCLTLLVQRFERKATREKSKRAMIAAWIQRIGSRDIFYLFPAFIVLGALIMTASRAGFVSMLIGVGSFTLALAINQKIKKTKLLIIGFIGLVLLTGILLLGGDILLARLNNGSIGAEGPIRISIYKLVLQAIADNPWLGSGVGTFDEAFRLYRDMTVSVWAQRAHSDYLEMAMDLGIPSAIMLWASIILMISCCIDGVRTRQRFGEFPVLAFAASMLAATHATVDFSFHIPAVSETYAAILGLGVAQSWSSRKVKN